MSDGFDPRKVSGSGLLAQFFDALDKTPGEPVTFSIREAKTGRIRRIALLDLDMADALEESMKVITQGSLN